jgi:hypothetical protein
MTLRLNGSTSGFTEIDAPAVAGSNTLTLPGGNGTNGQVLTTDGAGALSFTTVAGAGSLADGSAAAPSVAFASDVNTGIFRAGNDLLAFSTGGTERAQFDASGRLLVGTSSSTTTSGGQSPLQVVTLGGSNVIGVSAFNFSNGDDGGELVLGSSRGASAGSFTVVQNNDTLGRIRFAGADGTDLATPGAFITAKVDGTPGANDLPTRLVFSVTADGASSPTERMSIQASGRNRCFGTDEVHESYTGSAAGTTISIYSGGYNRTTVSSGGTTSYYVWSNGNVVNTNNSYGAISDIKLKKNIVDANSQWNDLKALKVRKYNFKEGPTHTQIGLVAQEVELVSPGLVSESPDRDEEGNDLGTVTKSVNYSVLYMKAVKALQEAMERIETLEARLTALEVTP